MPNTLLIAQREFRQQIRKRGFWISSIAVPLVLLVVWAFTGALEGGSLDSPPAGLEPEGRPEQAIGYVDQADLIRTIPDPVPDDLFKALPDPQAAEAALAAGEIGAYYLISPDYRETGQVDRISQRLTISPDDVRWFNQVLLANLFPEADAKSLSRLRQPFYGSSPEFVEITPAGQAEESGASNNNFLPFLVTIAIMIPLFTGGSYLFQSLTQEKGSRVIEILLVSLRPRQLLTGKLLGLSVLILVQYTIWIAFSMVAALATNRNIGGILSQINLSTYESILIIPFALGGFLLYAALMAGIGALARDIEDSRIWLFVISLPMMIPIYLWTLIVSAPNGAVALSLSIFPFSAPVAMIMRLTSTSVPGWQIALSLLLLFVTGIGLIQLMARLFHAHMLLSGESLSVRRFWNALSG